MPGLLEKGVECETENVNARVFRGFFFFFLEVQPSAPVLTVVFLLRYMSNLDCHPLGLIPQDMSP